MIARVVPLTRLPKGLEAFDYLVPDELEQTLRLGHLVTVPFRASTMLGVILSFVDPETLTYSATRLKQLLSVIGVEPFLSTAQLEYATTVASWYGVSLGTIIKTIAPPLQKRKIQTVSFLPFLTAQNIYTEPAYTVYTSAKQHRQVLAERVAHTGQTLILLPEMQCIDEVFDLLTKDIQQQTTLWHSGLSVKDQFERCIQIRNGEKKIIVGLRGSVFLSFHNLQSIVVDYEHHEQHKHWDQAPRFHDIDLAHLLSQKHNSALHLMSFAPSVSAAHEFSLTTPPLPATSLPTIIDMRAEHQGSHLALTLEEKIQQTSGDIFLFLNRRGFSRHIECGDCGNVMRCPQCQLPLIHHEAENILSCHYCKHQEALPLVCSACRSTRIRQLGFGTQFIESAIKKLLPKERHSDIYRIDSDVVIQTLGATTAPRIIIGTEMAFPYIRWNETQLIGVINIDQQLGLPEYLAEEHVWHILNEIAFRKVSVAEWYIQTLSPDREIFHELAQPANFYKRILQIRKQLTYPPFCYIVKYFCGNDTAGTTRQSATKLYQQLSILTKDKKTITITDPFEMHPQYFRGKFWYGILARLDTETWQTDLAWLNKHIPSDWKIDPHPISILSP